MNLWSDLLMLFCMYHRVANPQVGPGLELGCKVSRTVPNSPLFPYTVVVVGETNPDLQLILRLKRSVVLEAASALEGALWHHFPAEISLLLKLCLPLALPPKLQASPNPNLATVAPNPHSYPQQGNLHMWRGNAAWCCTYWKRLCS